MLFILSESRAFSTFFVPRVSKIQAVAKMYKMHTIQNKRQRKRVFCTFFAPRVSKIQVVAKMHKMHTIQNKRQRKRVFCAFQFDKRKTKSDLNLMKGEKYADRTFKENG